MTESVTIVQALTAVMADVGAVAKKDRNTHANFNFRGIDAVVNACSPALRAAGVVVVPDVLSCAYELVQTTTGKPSTACRVQVAYTFHGPAGDSIRTTVIGEAWDSGDKAAPKAMSVAFRTALLQALCLPTDETEPDAQTYERANNPPPAAPAPRITAAQRTAAEDEIDAAPDPVSLRALWAKYQNDDALRTRVETRGASLQSPPPPPGACEKCQGTGRNGEYACGTCGGAA